MIEIVDFIDFSYGNRSFCVVTKNHGEFSFIDILPKSLDEIEKEGMRISDQTLVLSYWWREGIIILGDNGRPKTLKNYKLNEAFIENTILKTLLNSKDIRIKYLFEKCSEILKIAARKRIKTI